MFSSLMKGILGMLAVPVANPDYEVFENTRKRDLSDKTIEQNEFLSGDSTTFKKLNQCDVADALGKNPADLFYDFLLGSHLESEVDGDLNHHVASKINELMSSPHIIVEAMPLMPSSIIKLTYSLSDDDYDIALVLDIIESEPSIAGLLVNLANSQNYNNSNKDVTELKQAFMMIGGADIKKYILSSYIEKLVPANNLYFKMFGEKMWAHAKNTAEMASRLAEIKFGKAEAKTAYFIGLIFDIGNMIILQLLLDAFKHVAPDCHPGNQVFKMMMKDKAHFLTEKIAEHWNLPKAITHALGEFGGDDHQVCFRQCICDSQMICILTELYQNKLIDYDQYWQFVHDEVSSTQARDIALDLID